MRCTNKRMLYFTLLPVKPIQRLRQVKSKRFPFMDIHNTRQMGTLKPHSNGPLFRNTVIGTMVVDVWAVTFGTARCGLGGLHCAQSPACCTKCNSPPINGQCTNFTLQLHCNPAAINCWRFRLFCLIYSVRCSCNVPDMRVSP